MKDVIVELTLNLFSTQFLSSYLAVMFPAIVLSVHVYIVAHLVIALILVELKKICAIFNIIICLYLYYRWYFKYKKKERWLGTN